MLPDFGDKDNKADSKLKHLFGCFYKKKMSHTHHSSKVSMPRLLVTIILNLVITIAQVIGGIISGSLALISDAIHNLSDSVSVILAYIAQKLSQKPTTQKLTFGYKRAEILAAFINALALIAISIYLVFEAIERILNPEQVNAMWMFWLGLLGLVANGISVFILEREKHKNLNIKAAYLHLLGDALTSLAVVLGAVIIRTFNILWVDAAVTILISIYLFVHTFQLLKESTTILMQMAPANINVNEIEEQLQSIDSIKDIHHIHVWNLTEKLVHFECHIKLNKDLPISETNDVYEEVEQILHDKYNIEHLTVQFEFDKQNKKNCNC